VGIILDLYLEQLAEKLGLTRVNLPISKTCRGVLAACLPYLEALPNRIPSSHTPMSQRQTGD
jgi:hypothetical protein